MFWYKMLRVCVLKVPFLRHSLFCMQDLVLFTETLMPHISLQVKVQAFKCILCLVSDDGKA